MNKLLLILSFVLLINILSVSAALTNTTLLNDTFETVYERMVMLRKYKQSVYVMRDESIKHKPEFIALAAWGNSMGSFKYPLEELIYKSEKISQYKKFFIDKI